MVAEALALQREAVQRGMHLRGVSKTFKTTQLIPILAQKNGRLRRLVRRQPTDLRGKCS